MTIKELYEEAKAQGKEDYEISVCDNYGSRSTAAVYPEYDDEKEEVWL